MAQFADQAIFDLAESRDGSEPPGFVAGKGSAVILGFVNGTFRGFCRPSGYEQQRSDYSGHKRSGKVLPPPMALSPHWLAHLWVQSMSGQFGGGLS